MGDLLDPGAAAAKNNAAQQAASVDNAKQAWAAANSQLNGWGAANPNPAFGAQIARPPAAASPQQQVLAAQMPVVAGQKPAQAAIPPKVQGQPAAPPVQSMLRPPQINSQVLSAILGAA